MEKRIRNVQGCDGLNHIVSDRDALMKWQDEMEGSREWVEWLLEKLEVIETQVPNNSEWRESIKWADENLKSFSGNLESVNQDVVVMTNKPLVFKKSLVDLKKSLPTCTYPGQHGSNEVASLTKTLTSLMQQRNDMVITLMQDNSGEMMIRGSVTSDKNLLNSKAIVYRAMTNLHNIEQQIRDSITNQAGIVSQLIVEMGRGSDL